jgi:hypothetical protein
MAEAGELARLAAEALVEAVPRLLDTRAAVWPADPQQVPDEPAAAPTSEPPATDPKAEQP